STVVVANHRFADLRGADVSADVERCALLFEATKISIQSSPIDREFVLLEKRFLRRDGFFILRSDRSALAGNFRGDPLGELAERAIVEEQRDFRLAKHVDEARSDDAAFGVNFALRSEEHTSELQSRFELVCRHLLEKKKDQVKPFFEGVALYGNYAHGTLVAGIAIAGNPAARIMVIRNDWLYEMIPSPPNQDCTEGQ